MWYHAGLYFDYMGFESEARFLAGQIDNGDISLLRARAEEVVREGEFRSMLSKYGFGLIPEPLPSTEEVNKSTERNSKLGQWFSFTLIKYLIPSPFSIGYNWRQISETLPLLGWSDSDIQLLINGLPVDLLLGKQVIPKKVINHNDAYWYWIRPRYSYNQGGFLPKENCESVLSLLRKAQHRINESELSFPTNLPKDQEKNWRSSLTKGLEDAIAWIETALNQKLGIYSAIYWEWDEVEDQVDHS